MPAKKRRPATRPAARPAKRRTPRVAAPPQREGSGPAAAPPAAATSGAVRRWLFKSEPSVFSIDDLAAAPDGTTLWEGVRNYQARNLLRDEVRRGDLVLFHHSSSEPPGVAGLAEVVREAYPDPSQFDRKSPYHDPGSPRDAPRWLAVDVRFVRKFPRVVSLDRMKAEPALAAMDVLRRGNRLSIQRVRPEEFEAVLGMAGEVGQAG